MPLEIIDKIGDRVMWGKLSTDPEPTAANKGGNPLQPGDKYWNCDTDETKVYCNGSFRASLNG